MKQNRNTKKRTREISCHCGESSLMLIDFLLAVDETADGFLSGTLEPRRDPPADLGEPRRCWGEGEGEAAAARRWGEASLCWEATWGLWPRETMLLFCESVLLYDSILILVSSLGALGFWQTS